MQIRIFMMSFSARLGGFGDEPLRGFLADKQVHLMESWHFIHGGVPYWSVLACYSMDKLGHHLFIMLAAFALRGSGLSSTFLPANRKRWTRRPGFLAGWRDALL